VANERIVRDYRPPHVLTKELNEKYRDEKNETL
jgi:hypothetical protein